MSYSIRILIVSALAFAAAACSGSSGRSKTRPVITNLGIAVSDLSVGQNLVALLVSETEQGGIDRNGDGDSVDQVVHVLDLSTRQVTNLGLAGRLSVFEIEDDVVVFGVLEAEQGGVDLNGDGDALDRVVHVYSAASGVTNLALAGESVHGGTRVLVSVDEAAQGTDLNLDSDALDSVMHLYDVEAGTTRNLELALAPFGRGQVYRDPAVAVFHVSEARQGDTDFNGDGDAEDVVWHMHDVGAGVTTNLAVAAGSENVRTGRSSNADEPGLLVEEASQGETDLNADGDAADFVVHHLDATAGVPHNVGIAAIARDPHGHGGIMAFRVGEAAEAGVDRNLDGDAVDEVMHVYDFVTGDVRNLELASPTVERTHHLQIFDNRVGFLVNEADHGSADLNGDGDALDWVPHVYDAVSDRITNLGIAAWVVPSAGRLQYLTDEILIVRAYEADHGGADLNGDGDSLDIVFQVHDLDRDRRIDLRLATDPAFLFSFAARGGLAVLLASELEQGVDLNADGDLDDLVAHRFDAAASKLANLELASRLARVGADVIVCVALEDGRIDWNGDGDTDDGVLHLVE